ncbi:MAG: ComEC/Rec2 family competence protein [Rhodobacteraceae bacterium]|nr:ComEC/Rec2 family competence protein [Paracoccaceae bacterium]
MAALLLALLITLVLSFVFSGIKRLLTVALILLISGYFCATYRSYSVAAPILQFRYYGPVEGRIVKVDRSSSNAVRVLLDRVIMTDIRWAGTPEKVRVSLFGHIPDGLLEPGRRVVVVANMSPPGAPVEPGGFDFRIMAWFDGIGGVGYSRNPILEMRPYPDNSHWLARVRQRIAEAVYEKIGGQNGAFAGAILTGDRSRIDRDILDQLRASNLAHLLAISGLHMGLLTGFIYMIFRSGLTLHPRASLYLPVKKIGAGFALLAGLAYLFMSGGNVATQRAFVMVAVVLIAVIFDRPAFTLRAVALAAFIVLILRPESLSEAGFQMSFAATTALIGVFDGLRRLNWWREARNGPFARLMPFVGLIITSSVAGLATAPFSAFHFNQLSNFGLGANLLSVPVMGLAVMPAAVVAGLLSLVGYSEPAFWVMGQGIGWILAVAEYFANLPAAVTHMKSGAAIVLPLFAISGCLLFLVQGVFRLSGFAVAAVALFLWAGTPRPHILIDENGALLGVLFEQGRVLNKETAYRFAAGSWLENDGDGKTQAQAYARDGFLYQGTQTRAELSNGWSVVLERARPDPSITCTISEIFIAPKWPDPPTGGCFFVGQAHFDHHGGIAINFVEDAPVLQFAAPDYPARPWNSAGYPYQ